MSNQDKTIIRVAKNRDNPYVMINKGFLDYEALSFKAKGILTYLLSRPDNWEIMITHLVKVSTEKESAIRSGLDELIKYGYIEKIAHRDSKGRFTNFEYIIYETQQEFLVEESKKKENKPKKSKKKSAKTAGSTESYPIVEKPKVGKPKVGYPQVENQALIINDFNNKEFNNNDFNNNNEKFQEDENVVVLKKEIEKVLETPISYPTVLKLLSQKGESIIRSYLDNWSKFNGSKNNVVGYFIDMVTKEYDIPKSVNGKQNKPEQSTNFEQRVYDDEYFESLYENFR